MKSGGLAITYVLSKVKSKALQLPLPPTSEVYTLRLPQLKEVATILLYIAKLMKLLVLETKVLLCISWSIYCACVNVLNMSLPSVTKSTVPPLLLSGSEYKTHIPG